MAMSDPDETHPDGAAVAWFARLRDSAASDADRAAFAAWRAAPAHARAYAELERIWEGVGEAEPIGAARPPRGDAAVWTRPTRARAGIRASRDKRPDRQWRAGAAAAVAAIAVVGAGAGWLSLPASAFVLGADHRTGIGAPRQFTLADGTVVSLDADSAIAVRETPTSRHVELLSGRAVFQVVHDPIRRFSVVAGEAVIRDVGTVFEVDRTAGGGRVAVAEGAVQVQVGGGLPEPLVGGAAMTYGQSAAPAEVSDPAIVGAWRQDRLVFVDAPLGEVLADLQRYRGGRFLVLDRGLAGRRVTGVFDTRRPDAALASILKLSGARARALGPLTLLWKQG